MKVIKVRTSDIEIKLSATEIALLRNSLQKFHPWNEEMKSIVTELDFKIFKLEQMVIKKGTDQ
jgi:hypothetical protein